MRSVVFDASALICLVRREPGWERVASFGLSAVISAVNVVEVAYGLKRHGMPLDAVDAAIRPVIGTIVPLDDQHAYATAVMHEMTRVAGLSLADCACLALGAAQKGIVVTADKQWQKLGLDLKIVQIR